MPTTLRSEIEPDARLVMHGIRPNFDPKIHDLRFERFGQSIPVGIVAGWGTIDSGKRRFVSVHAASTTTITTCWPYLIVIHVKRHLTVWITQSTHAEQLAHV